MASFGEKSTEMVVAISYINLLYLLGHISTHVSNLPILSTVRAWRVHIHWLNGPRVNLWLNSPISSIYIGIPRFANDYINKHELNLDGLTITDPRPNSFHVTHVEKLHLGGGIPGIGHLTAFNTSFRAPGTEKEFAELSFPRLDFDRGESTLDLDQDINLSCMECFSKLAAAAITGEKFEFLVTGRPELKLGAFPTAHLRIHKMVQMSSGESTQLQFWTASN